MTRASRLRLRSGRSDVHDRLQTRPSLTMACKSSRSCAWCWWRNSSSRGRETAPGPVSLCNAFGRSGTRRSATFAGGKHTVVGKSHGVRVKQALPRRNPSIHVPDVQTSHRPAFQGTLCGTWCTLAIPSVFRVWWVGLNRSFVYGTIQCLSRVAARIIRYYAEVNLQSQCREEVVGCTNDARACMCPVPGRRIGARYHV